MPTFTEAELTLIDQAIESGARSFDEIKEFHRQRYEELCSRYNDPRRQRDARDLVWRSVLKGEPVFFNEPISN